MLQACSLGWPLHSFQNGRAARQRRTVCPLGNVIVDERLRGGLDSMCFLLAACCRPPREELHQDLVGCRRCELHVVQHVVHLLGAQLAWRQYLASLSKKTAVPHHPNADMDNAVRTNGQTKAGGTHPRRQASPAAGDEVASPARHSKPAVRRPCSHAVRRAGHALLPAFRYTQESCASSPAASARPCIAVLHRTGALAAKAGLPAPPAACACTERLAQHQRQPPADASAASLLQLHAWTESRHSSTQHLLTAENEQGASQDNVMEQQDYKRENT